MQSSSTDRLIVPLLSLGNFVIGMGAFVIVGLLEPLGEDMNRSAAGAGQLLTVYSLSYAVLSPLLVALTGQVGRRRVLALAAFLFALAAALSALAPSFAVLNLGRVLAAAGAGIFTPVAAAVAATLYPEAQRARVLASVFFGLTLSQVLGVPVGSWIAYTFGWRWAFWLVLALSLPLSVMIWRRIPAGLTFQPVTMQDLRQVMVQGRMMLAVMFTGTILGSMYVMFTYVAPLLSNTMGYGRDGITAMLLMFGLGAVCGNILGGYFADRFGWYVTLTTLCIIQVLLMPLYSLLPFPDWALAVLCFTWSSSGWAFMAGQQMRLIGLAGAQAPVVLALNAAAIYIGAAVGSAIGGLVLAGFGLSALGVAAGAAAFVALIHFQLSAKFPPKAPSGP